MPYTQTTHYLGAHYQVSHPYRWHTVGPMTTVTVSRDPIIKPCADDLDLGQLWRTFRRETDLYGTREEFRAYLRSLIRFPESIDALTFCDDCQDPGWGDELDSGNRCESCQENYSYCNSCDETRHYDSFMSVLGDDSVCERCVNRYYSYCDHCEGYYPDGEVSEHDHEQGSGCCESPELEFTIRNDGDAPLANDTRAAFTLPAGTISAAGLKALRQYLDRETLNYDLAYGFEAALGDHWQARDGNYPKRLSRYAYQSHQEKLSPKIMSQVGTIARDHSNAVDVAIEVTRDFNQSAEYFYHEDSCYWGGYYESRCALKTNGGFAVRSFDSYGSLSGRALVLPLRIETRPGASELRCTPLAPTFDTMRADAFVVFNGYGDMGGYAAARIMAHMSGWTYRKIAFSCDPMYINSGGYLVAGEELANQYTDGSLHLSVSQHSSLYESEMAHA